MGASFKVMRVCHDRETRRRLRTSERGRELIIWICNSFGRERNSSSRGNLLYWLGHNSNPSNRSLRGEDLPGVGSVVDNRLLRRRKRLKSWDWRGLLGMQERDFRPKSEETRPVETSMLRRTQNNGVAIGNLRIPQRQDEWG